MWRIHKVMRRGVPVLLAAVTLLTSGAIRAGAGTEGAPEIRDAAGDANGVNRQQYVFVVPDDGPDTRPASIAGADLRAVWFETAYETSRNRDASTGEILAVSHTPTGLKVNIKTEGPIASPGHTLWFEVFTNLSEICEETGWSDWVRFRLRVPGPASPDMDRPARAEIILDRCYAPMTLTDEVDLTIDDDIATLTLPFSVPGLSQSIYPGQGLTPSRAVAGVQLVNGYTWPEIDRTGPGDEFVIGSDLPADVDCIATPDHPECLE